MSGQPQEQAPVDIHDENSKALPGEYEILMAFAEALPRILSKLSQTEVKSLTAERIENLLNHRSIGNLLVGIDWVEEIRAEIVGYDGLDRILVVCRDRLNDVINAAIRRIILGE